MSDAKTEPTRLDRWSKLTDWPLMGVAVLFLVAYAVPIMDLDLARRPKQLCRSVVWLTWAVLAVDYVVRVVLAENRLRYWCAIGWTC